MLADGDISATDCEPLLSIQTFTRDLDQACHMTTVTAFQGMSVWRWLLFVGLFWPLELVAYAIVCLLTLMVHTKLLGKHVRFSSRLVWLSWYVHHCNTWKDAYS